MTQEPDTISALTAFGRAFDYDTSYLTDLAVGSPEAFRAFDAARTLAEFRSVLPLDLHFVARIAAMRSEECGACARLNLRLALEAGVGRDLLSALIDSPATMPALHQDVALHAAESARGLEPDPSRVHRLRDALGDDGFGELAVLITGCRLYPGLKRALAHGSACVPLTLD
ncbi:MAG: hypothetical protein AAF196_01450 [Planctomycetota bacterium]